VNLLPAFVGAPEVNRVYHCDALTLLRALPAGSVDAVITDPPFYNVLDIAWDRQWENRESFIHWLTPFLLEFNRVLKPNGSLFLFAWPKVAAYVEVEIGRHFHVLNQIVWDKANGTTAQRAERAALRSFIPNTERIIFAEQRGADEFAQDASGFDDACIGLRKRIFGDYINSEMERAQIGAKELAGLFPSITGNTTGCVSNWLLGYNTPTPQQYERIRQYLNEKTNSNSFLRQEYESLRQEYEELRRPFDVTSGFYTDVWRFKTAQQEGMMHPAQKPIALLEYIAKVATRPNDLILDPFMGSGTTAIAARNTGRRFICGDLDAGYVEIARQRLAQPYTPDMFLQAVGE
jgi:adenine-specific DNA-methyltransferase